MKRILLFPTVILLIFLFSCSKKTHPSGSTSSTSSSTVETKTAKPKTVRTAVPKVIVVNDQVAKRSVDGRYYYDLEGHRYWRNNRDGKYYLYYKGIFDNPDFKAPVTN